MSPSPPPLLHYTDMAFLALHHHHNAPPPPPPPTPLLPALEYPLDHTHTPQNKPTIFHHHHQQQQQQHIFFNKHSFLEGFNSMEGWGAPPSPSATTTCEDCGNQRKKDCVHHRCRTCCRNRGFICATHVKSTWVPASRRRERQAASAVVLKNGTGSSGSRTTATSHASIGETVRSLDTGCSQHCREGGEEMPGRVWSAAVFKCMRVSAVEDGGEEEYAYQGVVKIGGHVFKGVLYDQGSEGGILEGVSDLNLVYAAGDGDSMFPRHLMMDGCGGGFGNGGWE